LFSLESQSKVRRYFCTKLMDKLVVRAVLLVYGCSLKMFCLDVLHIAKLNKYYLKT